MISPLTFYQVDYIFISWNDKTPVNGIYENNMSKYMETNLSRILR